MAEIRYLNVEDSAARWIVEAGTTPVSDADEEHLADVCEFLNAAAPVAYAACGLNVRTHVLTARVGMTTVDPERAVAEVAGLVRLALRRSGLSAEISRISAEAA